MGKRPAGARYPHATTRQPGPAGGTITTPKEADHRFCPVLAAVAAEVDAGREPWGTPHVLPSVATEAEARDAEAGLYRARNHTGRKRGPCHDKALSVRATCAPDGGRGRWIVTLQVWDRATARAEIVRRVRDGEQLAYNVRRK